MVPRTYGVKRNDYDNDNVVDDDDNNNDHNNLSFAEGPRDHVAL